jgi:hypothetical protein
MENEIMSFAEKWMELEIIMLSDIMTDWKNKYYMFSYAESRLCKTGNCGEKAMGGGQGEREYDGANRIHMHE